MNDNPNTMSKKKDIIVTIKEVTRKSKRLYQVTIDLPGNNPDDSPREYYATVYSAKRGAKRKLDAFHYLGSDGKRAWVALSRHSMGRTMTRIEFVIIHKKKATK